MNKVVHCKKEKFDVYIGRPSIWGNPFTIGKDGTREEVLIKFENYLLNNANLMGKLYLLKDKVLGCWCHPNRCHGNILIEVMEKFKI